MNKDEARRAAMDTVAAVVEQSLRDTLRVSAKKGHPTAATAEMSHTARIALERLAVAAVEQGMGKTEISVGDLEAVKEALRTVQNSGHLAFLKAHGAEADYQAIGRKVDKEQKSRRRRRA